MLSEGYQTFQYPRKRRMAVVESLPARVIAISSGKGGVGKTHTSVNLALALAKKGKRVLIVDADLGLANVNILLGFKAKATLHEVVQSERPLSDVVVSHQLGIDIIPAASGVADLVSLTDQTKQFLIQAFDEFAKKYDYILIDNAAGIGSNVMYFNLAAEDVIVVVDPEPTSRTDAYALIKVCASEHGIKEFKIIANRVPKDRDGREIYAQLSQATDKFLQVGLKYLGQITYDASVNEAVMMQRPYLDAFPGSQASLDVQKVAEKLIAEEGRRKPKGGMQFFFNSLLDG